jgi:hypothetical protein
LAPGSAQLPVLALQSGHVAKRFDHAIKLVFGKLGNGRRSMCRSRGKVEATSLQ